VGVDAAVGGAYLGSDAIRDAALTRTAAFERAPSRTSMRTRADPMTLRKRNKVMQIENDYDNEVYNGDIGYIDDIDPEAGELKASFDGRSVTYGFGELDTLVPALPPLSIRARAPNTPP
jgi:ATP-dependent exoDNAse (exonuclease V) alpha subunit